MPLTSPKKLIRCVKSAFARRIKGKVNAHGSWFGHVCRHDTLPKIILEGTVDGTVVAEEDLVNHGKTTSKNGQAS